MSKILICLSVFAFVLSGCVSGKVKEKRAEREKISQLTGLYCDFVNAEEVYDAEVELNLEMAKKCDPEKNFSISSFRTVSEHRGILYCCGLVKKASAPEKVEPKKENSTKSKDVKAEVPEAKIEAPKVEPKVETKAEAKTDHKADTKSEAKPENKAENK